MLFALLLCTGAAPALACSIGSGHWENDRAEAFRSNPQVFVAQVLSFREVPPTEGAPYGRNQVDYAVVEVLKGQPDVTGTLNEMNPYLVRPGQPPGPSCGPWLAVPSHVGRTVVVFAWPERVRGEELLWANPFSFVVEPGEPDSDDMLQKIRTFALKNETK